MTQVDLGTAGIKANIVHWNAVVNQRADDLNEAIQQLNYWLAQAKKDLDAKTLHL
jgi:hypothetical protein